MNQRKIAPQIYPKKIKIKIGLPPPPSARPVLCFHPSVQIPQKIVLVVNGIFINEH